MPIPKEELQTRFASEARELAEAFNEALGPTRVARDWRPELLAPDVLSTAGGVQATLHLRLVPPRGSSNVAFVVGNANPKDHAAELRTFDHADRLHRERHGVAIVVPRADYDAFLDVAERFFRAQGMQTTRVGPPSLPPPSIPPPARKLAPIALVAVTIVLLLVLFFWLKK